MKNLLELVPRDLSETLATIDSIQAQYPQVTGFNIPDILRMPNRSYDVAAELLDRGIFVVPHIRTIDLPLDDTVALISKLVDKGLTHVLIITGDVPTAFQETYQVTPLQVIGALKNKYPDLNVYAGLDPYRGSFNSELAYSRQKLDAGADGFFSQPFFDARLASVWLDLLADADFFLGFSPVLSERSYHYWVTKNKAVFPTDFKSEWGWNTDMARQLLSLAESANQHMYHMPIRVTALDYLSNLY